jgi:two-component system, OmpR family, response regulator
MVEKHILAVDDDPMMRQLIGDYLSGHGFRVSTVARGQEMVRVIDEEVIDLIVLDLKL